MLATTIQNRPKLKDAADIFLRSLYAPCVMGSAVQPLTKSGTPLIICETIAQSDARWRVETEIVEMVTIARPDRPGESRTYDLTTHSPLARRLLADLLNRDWADTGTTAGGWDYYTNR